MPGFKPMVKMMTTEPSVELKLKKGGKVEKKMQQGGLAMDAMPADSQLAMPPARGGEMPGKRPMRPSLMARRRAMRGMPTSAGPSAPVGDAARMAEATAPMDMPPMGMPPMGMPAPDMGRPMMAKKGGKVDAMKKLKEHAGKPASKAHKGLKTGGVVMGQGGYKMGGAVNMAKGGSSYEESSDRGNVIKTKSHKTTEMNTAHRDTSPAKTGEVKMGNAGGYKTGGVVKGNAGGYKKGGMAKGGKMPMKDGKPAFLEKGMMGGGMMAGYKDGGDVKKPRATGNVDDSGAPVAMPQGSKKPGSPVYVTQLAGTYKKGGKVTPAEGRLQKMFNKENASAMKAAKADSNEKYAKGGALLNPKIGSVTETEKSVTVTPAKRGGAMRRPC